MKGAHMFYGLSVVALKYPPGDRYQSPKRLSRTLPVRTGPIESSGFWGLQVLESAVWAFALAV